MSRLQKITLSIIMLIICLCYNLSAHTTTTKHLSDSTIIQPDSVDLSIQNDVNNITDSTSVESLVTINDVPNNELKLGKKTFKPNPTKAVIYSAIFPGLGQIYNGKYWKLPILYGGFVGVSYAITWNNSHYQDYFGAYRDILDDNPNTNSWHSLVPYQYKNDPESVDKNWFTGVLKDRKNYFRYYRDLSVIIGVALYGLGIVDAYVDAQLFEFDVSPDLSLKFEPVLMQRNNSNNYLADTFGLKCSFSF